MLMSPERNAFNTAAQQFGLWLDRLEAELGTGPDFNGANLALVDCAFAPLLMRAALMEPYLGLGALDRRPRPNAWSEALLGRDSQRQSVVPEFAKLLIDNWRHRAPLGRDLFGKPAG